MSRPLELFYFNRVTGPRPSPMPIEFLSVGEFLTEEAACRTMWELVAKQFTNRSKFLAVWSGVRFVAVHRDDKGNADGFLLVNAPVNWQIDYIAVRPESRGRGIGAALLIEALDQAFHRRVPFVTLTGKPALRPHYESLGFVVPETMAEAIPCDSIG